MVIIDRQNSITGQTAELTKLLVLEHDQYKNTQMKTSRQRDTERRTNKNNSVNVVPFRLIFVNAAKTPNLRYLSCSIKMAKKITTQI